MKTDRFTIDANVFISFLTENEIHHRESKAFMNFVMKNKVKILVPLNVVFETFHTLRRRDFFESKENYITFQKILNLPGTRYFFQDFDFFNMFKKFNFFWKLKTADAILATTALLTDSPLISWDNNVVKYSHNGYTPVEYLEKFSF